MSTFKKDNLVLLSQGVGGGSRTWSYTDTGLIIADINRTAGYFTTGYDMGMRHGDRVFITEGDTGTFVEKPVAGARQVGGRRQYCTTVIRAVDTGTTQITFGTGEIIGDTGTS